MGATTNRTSCGGPFLIDTPIDATQTFLMRNPYSFLSVVLCVIVFFVDLFALI